MWLSWWAVEGSGWTAQRWCTRAGARATDGAGAEVEGGHGKVWQVRRAACMGHELGRGMGVQLHGSRSAVNHVLAAAFKHARVL